LILQIFYNLNKTDLPYIINYYNAKQSIDLCVSENFPILDKKCLPHLKHYFEISADDFFPTIILSVPKHDYVHLILPDKDESPPD